MRQPRRAEQLVPIEAVAVVAIAIVPMSSPLAVAAALLAVAALSLW